MVQPRNSAEIVATAGAALAPEWLIGETL